jgi:hypothetical protein
MPLTSAQIATLRADILADPTLTAIPAGSDGDFTIAAIYNTIFTPSWWVYKSSVPVADVKDALNYTTYIGRSVAEREAFTFMLSNHVIAPNRPNIRQGINDIFSGSGATPVAQRAAFDVLFRREATRAEKLFATGTGTTVSPGTMTVEGAISYQDVGAARAL